MSDFRNHMSHVVAPGQLWPRLIADRDDEILRDIRMAVHSVEFSQGWQDDTIPFELINIIDEVQFLQLLLHPSRQTRRPHPYIAYSAPQFVPPGQRASPEGATNNLSTRRCPFNCLYVRSAARIFGSHAAVRQCPTSTFDPFLTAPPELVCPSDGVELKRRDARAKRCIASEQALTGAVWSGLLDATLVALRAAALRASSLRIGQ
ncbi:hypothetical protein PF003_g15201 [Phytophthora fragariae]|nr:hypothetical protein PF003_g15201 [Phytophthora fragariae]